MVRPSLGRWSIFSGGSRTIAVQTSPGCSARVGSTKLVTRRFSTFQSGTELVLVLGGLFRLNLTSATASPVCGTYSARSSGQFAQILRHAARGSSLERDCREECLLPYFMWLNSNVGNRA